MISNKIRNLIEIEQISSGLINCAAPPILCPRFWVQYEIYVFLEKVFAC